MITHDHVTTHSCAQSSTWCQKTHAAIAHSNTSLTRSAWCSSHQLYSPHRPCLQTQSRRTAAATLRCTARPPQTVIVSSALLRQREKINAMAASADVMALQAVFLLTQIVVTRPWEALNTGGRHFLLTQGHCSR